MKLERLGRSCAGSCKELLANLKHNERIIRNNVFTTERGLEFYKYLLGRDFKARVRKLGPRDHWIDVGAGEAPRRLG